MSSQEKSRAHKDRISNEKYGRVVADQIPNAVVRVELDGETARIASRVRRAVLASDRREANTLYTIC